MVSMLDSIGANYNVMLSYSYDHVLRYRLMSHSRWLLSLLSMPSKRHVPLSPLCAS